MPVKKIVLLLALLGAIVPAHAETSYRGYAEFERRQVLGNSDSAATPSGDNAFKLRIEAGIDGSGGSRFGLQAFARKDTSDSGRDELRLDEAWGEHAFGNWNLRYGNQLFSWTSMESVSLVDVLNPRDFAEDILDAPRIGTPAVTLQRYLESGDLSLILLPYYSPSELPASDALYGFDAGLPVENADSRFAGQVALRWFHAGNGFDLALSVADLLERRPVFRPGPAFDRLLGESYRTRRYGLELTRVFGELIVKTELLYREPESDLLKPSLQAAVGLEKTLYSIWRQSDLTLFAEYLHDTSGGQQNDFPSLQNDLFVGARWALNDHRLQRFEAGIMQDLDDSGIYALRVEYARNLTDRVSLNASYTDANGFFYQANTDEDGDGVVQVSVRFSF